MTLKNNLKTGKTFNDTSGSQLVIIISIQSIHGVKILTEEKLLELRKSIPQGFVGWVYIYITKGKPYLFDKGIVNEHYVTSNDNPLKLPTLNGTVVARFWFDEYELIYPHYEQCNWEYNEWDFAYYVGSKTKGLVGNATLLNKLQLDDGEIEFYLNGEYYNDKEGYAWHIKNLEIFDEPMGLSEFVSAKLIQDVCGDEGKCIVPTIDYFINKGQTLTKAPQSWMYAYIKERKTK